MYLYVPYFQMYGITHTRVCDYTVSSGEMDGVCDDCHVMGKVQNGLCVTCLMARKPSQMRVLAQDVKLELFKNKARVVIGTGRNMLGLLVYGLVFPAHLYCSSANTLANEQIALCTRALTAVPKPDMDEWKAFFAWTDKNFKHIFPNSPSNLECVSFEEFNNSGHFPKATRMANERAFVTLQSMMEANVRAKNQDVQRWSVFKAFIKKEKQDRITDLGPCSKNKPRVIQACSPHATVATGMWFKAYQGYLHQEWNGNLLFAAGRNAVQLSKWYTQMVRMRPVILEDDFSLYDTTFSMYAHHYVMRLYERSGFHRTTKVAHTIRHAQCTSKGYSRFGFRYQTKGTMRSGVADTCLSNSIVNLLSHLYALHKLNPTKTFLKMQEQVAMVVLGDDNLTLLPHDYAYDMAPILKKLGFIPKLKRVKSPGYATFLNMRPYPTLDDFGQVVYQFAPKMARLISRLGYAVEEQQNPEAYVHGVATAFKNSCRHVPVLNDYVDRVCELTKRSDRQAEKSTYISRMMIYQMMDTGVDLEKSYAFGETQVTRDFICEIYTITPDELAHIREVVRDVKQLPCLCYDQVLERLIAFDLT
jgi:hypothetical protein